MIKGTTMITPLINPNGLGTFAAKGAKKNEIYSNKTRLVDRIGSAKKCVDPASHAKAEQASAG